jgi:hypothetical protein
MANFFDLADAPVRLAALRNERARIDGWIRARLIAWPPDRCLGCRLPILAGQRWRDVSDGDRDVRARFHAACYAEREAAARQALGLEG